MKSKLWIIGAFCVASMIYAQDAQKTVTTPGGDVNSVPKFSGSSMIGNSVIY